MRPLLLLAAVAATYASEPPNVLLVVADDWGFPHAGCYGDAAARTPRIDALARQGLRFDQAVVAAPQCAPSRAALLTGRNLWQLDEAGTHNSSFPARFPTLPDRLTAAGWFCGYTGKGWGPGSWQLGGRTSDPCGQAWNDRFLGDRRPDEGISNKDYAANFRDFLAARPAGRPFWFWLGIHEPHRGYTAGKGEAEGYPPGPVPAGLPDTPEVRRDLADYRREVAWLDRCVGEAVDELERRGELARTVIIITTDNGMPFPGAKATCREAGIRAPLIISGPGITTGATAAPVSLIDVAPTILTWAGLPLDQAAAGRPLQPLLTDGTAPWTREQLVGFERHSKARADDAGYPVRGLRAEGWLYLRNFAPERWPAGDPPRYGDIDNGPSKTALLAIAPHPYLDHRPAEELYDLTADPACQVNRAADPAVAERRAALRVRLEAALRAEGDPRILGHPEVFEQAPRPPTATPD